MLEFVVQPALRFRHYRSAFTLRHTDPLGEEENLVQHLIEKCLIFQMSKEECMEALSKHANIKHVITSTVWNELEKVNKEFFEAYANSQSKDDKMSEAETSELIQKMITNSSNDNSACIFFTRSQAQGKKVEVEIGSREPSGDGGICLVCDIKEKERTGLSSNLIRSIKKCNTNENLTYIALPQHTEIKTTIVFKPLAIPSLFTASWGSTVIIFIIFPSTLLVPGDRAGAMNSITIGLHGAALSSLLRAAVSVSISWWWASAFGPGAVTIV
ncbi:hypothetical protein V2J09_008301 [Rumex salicifolius]